MNPCSGRVKSAHNYQKGNPCGAGVMKPHEIGVEHPKDKPAFFIKRILFHPLPVPKSPAKGGGGEV